MRLRRPTWIRSAPVNQAEIDTRARAARDKAYEDKKALNKLYNVDVQAAYKAARTNLDGLGYPWPTQLSDSFVSVHGEHDPVKTWWAGSSPKHNVSFRMTEAGDILLTPMRGVRDIGATRPEAIPLEYEDPRLEDEQFVRDLLEGLRELAASKLKLLDEAKRTGRHRL